MHSDESKLELLNPPLRQLAARFVVLCEEKNIPLLIYCTLRTFADQARLFRNGRKLSEIELRARQLADDYGRQDLATILESVGPQLGQRIVTYAGPGQSLHNYGEAFDFVPMRNGKPVWSAEDPEDLALWTECGMLGESLGLEWAGRWQRFKEFPHFQRKGVRWQDLIVR